MLTENEADKLADAVQSWLDFQILCERDTLLSEAYLAQPIGAFLKNHHSGDIASEIDHPNIPTPNRGRPRQVDYALLSRDDENIVAAMEAKWVPTDRKVSRQRVLDDVLRMERLRSDASADRYFLVAGRSDDVSSNFFEAKYSGPNGYESFVKSILPTETNNDRKIRPVDLNSKVMRFFEKYSSKYSTQKEDVLVPKTYRSELIADKTEEKSRVMIWRIKSVPKKAEFDPRDRV